MDTHVANPLLPKLPEESLQALAALFLASLGDLSEDYSRLTREQMAQAILSNWDEVLEDHPATDFKAITSLKRKTMKNTVIDRSSDKIPNPQTMRLHMGELTGEEVLVAQSAYRLALAKDPISEDTIGKLIQILERAQEGLKELARFADEHGSCSSPAVGVVASAITRALRDPEVQFILPTPSTMRLHMGELTEEELLVAQSAYRLALTQAPVSSDTAEKLIQTLERAEEGLHGLAKFADEHGSCSSHALEHVAADIARVLASPEVRFIPRKALSDVAQYPTARRRASPW